MYECPVCSYPGLQSKPYELWPPPPDLELTPPYEDHLGRPSYEVCPRCGFEFGNDDNCLEDALRALIAAEAECCPFLEFSLQPEGANLRLEITGPSDADTIVDTAEELLAAL